MITTVQCSISNSFKIIFIYFYVGLKLQVCSLFFSLFQAHSTFRCVVMGANAR